VLIVMFVHVLKSNTRSRNSAVLESLVASESVIFLKLCCWLVHAVNLDGSWHWARTIDIKCELVGTTKKEEMDSWLYRSAIIVVNDGIQIQTQVLVSVLSSLGKAWFPNKDSRFFLSQHV
jgi:hypothetical protein